MKNYLTVTEFAKIFSISRQAVYKHLERKHIRYEFVGRMRLIKAREVKRFQKRMIVMCKYRRKAV